MQPRDERQGRGRRNSKRRGRLNERPNRRDYPKTEYKNKCVFVPYVKFRIRLTSSLGINCFCPIYSRAGAIRDFCERRYYYFAFRVCREETTRRDSNRFSPILICKNNIFAVRRGCTFARFLCKSLTVFDFPNGYRHARVVLPYTVLLRPSTIIRSIRRTVVRKENWLVA